MTERGGRGNPRRGRSAPHEKLASKGLYSGASGKEGAGGETLIQEGVTFKKKGGVQKRIALSVKVIRSRGEETSQSKIDEERDRVKQEREKIECGGGRCFIKGAES